MSINVKKYTKDQMAKMVEDAQEKNAALEVEITELKSCIDAKNDLIAENSAQCLNDQGQQYWRAWQASKREVADLKNKLNDTEAALGRANAAVDELKAGRAQQTKEIFEWQQSAQALHDDLLDARDCANYAEAHPWRNLWAWVKRKLAVKRD